MRRLHTATLKVEIEEMHDVEEGEIRVRREELNWLQAASLKVELQSCMMEKRNRISREKMSRLHTATLKVEIAKLHDEKGGGSQGWREELN